MNDHKLQRKLTTQIRRLRQSEQEKPTLLSQTAYIGTLGLLSILPIVGGAYFGRWLDNAMSGYSVRWTVSLIVIGVFVGGFNVYWFI
ncbi:MAG: ATP synthase protein I, partial [Cellvibrionaceae bacterium]